MINKTVLIRSYASGVHYGTLVSEQFTPAGKVVVLRNSKRVWCWSGSASLSQLAMEGVKNAKGTKITMPVDEIEVVNVVETIPLSDAAIENLNSMAVWKM